MRNGTCVQVIFEQAWLETNRQSPFKHKQH